MKALTQSIATICAVAFFSNASVWASPGDGQGGDDNDNMTQVTPLCEPISPGPGIIDGVNIYWQLDDDPKHFYSYDIILSSHVGNTWTYQVEAAEDSKDLSHWLLEIWPDCAGKVSSTSPNASMGTDGSTGIEGVKWDSKGGTFTLVMDDNYVTEKVNVWAKSSTYYGSCKILGPGCPLDALRGENESTFGFK